MSKILPKDNEWAREAFLLVNNDPRQKVFSTEEGDSQLTDIDPMSISLAGRTRYSATDTDLKQMRTDYFKFNDTALGGMEEINIAPQASRFADPHLPRLFDDLIEHFEGIKDIRCNKLGTWYSENIDDLGVRIHLRFGIPSYQSLWGFFSNYYSADNSRYVRLGRSGGLGSFIGKAIGWAFTLRLWPFILTGSAIKYFVYNTSTKFTVLKPMMATYWKYVNDVANTIATNMELSAGAGNAWLEMAESVNGTSNDYQGTEVPSLMEAQKKSGKGFDMTTPEGIAEINVYNSFLPDLFRSKSKDHVLSGINLHAVATRYQRLHNYWQRSLRKAREEASRTPPGLGETVISHMANGVFGFITAATTLSQMKKLATNNHEGAFDTAEDMIGAYLKTSWAGAAPSDGNKDGQTSAIRPVFQPSENDISTGSAAGGGPAAQFVTSANQQTAEGDGENPEPAPLMEDKSSSWIDRISEAVSDLADWGYDSVGQYLQAEAGEGSQWVSFRIAGKDSVTESFSTTTRQSDLGSFVNGISSTWRNKRISVAGGLIGSEIIKSITGFLGDLAANVMDELQIAGLGAIAGSAFADIPEHVDEVSAQFNDMSFTIPLRAPYGNDLSRYMNEVVPYVLLLVGAVPRSTGSNSYSGPFLCEWYCQSRGQSRLAVISNLSVTRAVGDMPWTANQRFRGLDITVQLKDLSSVMHMGLNEVSGLKALSPTRWSRLLFPQDSIFNDYTAVLAGMGLSQQVYKSDKLKRNWQQNVNKFSQWFDPATRVNTFFDGTPSQILTLFGKTSRR